jgi:hypothetical protein
LIETKKAKLFSPRVALVEVIWFGFKPRVNGKTMEITAVGFGM